MNRSSGILRSVIAAAFALAGFGSIASAGESPPRFVLLEKFGYPS